VLVAPADLHGVQLDFDGDMTTTTSKNWMRFHTGTDVYMVYTVHPWTILARNNGTWYRQHVSIYPPIAQSIEQYGYVFHGGTNAIRWHSWWLAGIHSIDPDGLYVNYLVLFQTVTPYNIHWISEPLSLIEERVMDGSVSHPIAFLSGIAYHTQREELWLAYGTSNVASRLLSIHKQQLYYLIPDKYNI